MKKISLFSICLFVFFVLPAQVSYLKYPGYETVVKKFFNTYSVDEIIADNSQVNFEKRPVGWVISVSDLTADANILREELFWNRKTNKFNKLKFEKIREKNANLEITEKYLADWSGEYYGYCPYYGYPGWDWDVINEFKDVTDLPESTLYALGRAYSSYAGNLLDNNSGMAKKENRFALSQGKNSMSPEQLDEYRKYSHLAIEKYSQLAKLNPNFETIVGKIGIKASNEYLTAFLNLRMYQNEEEAQKELSDGLYNNFYIAAAKNYLSSLSKDAILITNGDNDTYPLLYVQNKLGFRKDVLVVNVSLLQSDRYVNSLRDSVSGAAGIPVSLTADEITDNKRNFVILYKDEENKFDLSGFSDFIKSEENTTLFSENAYYFLPSNKLVLQTGENSLEWEINKDYIFLNHLLILDILATNKLQRPLYFAVTLDQENYLGLNDYLYLEGMAYRISPAKKETPDDYIGSVNTSLMFNNIMNNYDWSGIDKNAADDKVIIGTYRFGFIRLADELIKADKPDSAKLVLDKCTGVLPDNIIPVDYGILQVIQKYYEISDFNAGNTIAMQFINNIRGLKNNPDSPMAKNPEEYRDAAMNWLKDLAIHYDQAEIVSELEK